MSSTCPNCKTRLSCGCQKRTASNKQTVCTNCVVAYEAKVSGSAPVPLNIGVTNTVNMNTAPTNVTVFHNKYKQ